MILAFKINVIVLCSLLINVICYLCYVVFQHSDPKPIPMSPYPMSQPPYPGQQNDMPLAGQPPPPYDSTLGKNSTNSVLYTSQINSEVH